MPVCATLRSFFAKNLNNIVPAKLPHDARVTSNYLVRTPNGQISEMLHYTENIFNTYYCEIRFIVFHFNAGRYHVKFCFSSKTRVSHFRKSLETA